MKILYIGHYKENSGWSKAAVDLISSIDSAGVDITCRNIKLTDKVCKLPNRIMELESKPLQGIDFCIQHVLPHHLVGTSKFKKNISYYVSESNTLKCNNWHSNLNLMDEIWVPNHTQLHNMQQDGFKHLKYIPHAFDLSKYSSQTKARIDFKNDNCTFKFYYIADLNERKNIESVIKCFHSTFDRYEPVSLVLKIKKYGINPNDLYKHVTDICESIKKTLRIYPKVTDYHQEIIIPDDMKENEIDILHQTCDCFVNTTHGEGWSIPSFDAMCYGKTPVCSNEGGPKEYIKNQDGGFLVNGISGVCEHTDPAFYNIFTGRESWFVPDEEQTKYAMRFYYENRDKIDRTRGLKDAQEFSYENVGKMIKDSLNV
jgi:glycosyltransferase involved in cell wall biosynthesis